MISFKYDFHMPKLLQISQFWRKNIVDLCKQFERESKKLYLVNTAAGLGRIVNEFFRKYPAFKYVAWGISAMITAYSFWRGTVVEQQTNPFAGLSE